MLNGCNISSKFSKLLKTVNDKTIFIELDKYMVTNYNKITYIFIQLISTWNIFKAKL